MEINRFHEYCVVAKWEREKKDTEENKTEENHKSECTPLKTAQIWKAQKENGFFFFYEWKKLTTMLHFVHALKIQRSVNNETMKRKVAL